MSKGIGALVNEAGEELLLEARDFALVNEVWKKSAPKAGEIALLNKNEKLQYRNKSDKPFKMICGVPKEFE